MEKKGESRLRQAAEVGPRDGEDAGSPRASLVAPGLDSGSRTGHVNLLLVAREERSRGKPHPHGEEATGQEARERGPLAL